MCNNNGKTDELPDEIYLPDIPVEDFFPEGTVVMCGDPTPDLSIDEAKVIFQSVKNEKELAGIFALVSNKAWFIEDDIYDFEVGTPEYDKLRKIIDDWFELLDCIEKDIITILKNEGVIIPESGTFAVLTPFMERNGYRDGRGWWIETTE